MSDDEIIRGLKDSLGEERRAIRRFLELLRLFEARRLHAGTPHATVYAYCIAELGCSASDAYRRVHCARLCADHAVLLEAIERGELNLTSLMIIAPRLTQETLPTLLEKAKLLSTRDLQFYVAALSGETPVKRDVIRPLVLPSPKEEPVALELVSPPPQPTKTKAPVLAAPVLPVAPPEVPKKAARIEFTADDELLRTLDHVRALLSHKIPDGSLCAVFKETLEVFLKVKGMDLGSADPGREVLPGRRRIPKWVRRKVWRRDGGRCVWEGCRERRFLQYDHIVPFARGGVSDDPENIRLLCGAHNRRAAKDAGLI